ncbi:hypothetical protein SODALDRAFT_218492 [Sodiomyces alkalinus F11]|uniref:Uncharacterized protein n=1 Tax=Sodiomyces alkalinus (strain CBS 110278 / VKM F-3762 / F11) TaxID=1314773 RepID=A0A3N2PPE9_SODAK|nr:hypothetical protein SODALDRAFT_218492 [Sodiomyces alkalinus F11]ROT36382.1 hypothetical protein SODALDRAFT_218492 [Sodiomyces alkalinus F11]
MTARVRRTLFSEISIISCVPCRLAGNIVSCCCFSFLFFFPPYFSPPLTLHPL